MDKKTIIFYVKKCLGKFVTALLALKGIVVLLTVFFGQEFGKVTFTITFHGWPVFVLAKNGGNVVVVCDVFSNGPKRF